ncbi:hypothetical protein JXI42_05985 [bacterium]|nr:hypothetical protein [bacterium]
MNNRNGILVTLFSLVLLILRQGNGFFGIVRWGWHPWSGALFTPLNPKYNPLDVHFILIDV